MKALITGGAGFLGYHLANYFGDKGIELSLLDIAPFDPSEYPTGSEFIDMDVRDLNGLERLFADSKFDFVIHAAAALPLWSKKDIFTTNVDGTRNVLEVANKYKTRVVFISSTAVYGVPEKHPIYEIDPMVGVGNYGESKILAEKVCEEFREKGMCVPVIRPKTFIGTGRLGVFQILYDWVENGVRIPVIGNGKNLYQLFDVDDLVEAIFLTATASAEKANGTFNVGAKEFRTVKEDVGALCEFAGSGSKVMPIPSFIVKPALVFFEFLKLSPLYKWVYGTADKESFVSIEKIEKDLGWEPKYSNTDALIKSYKWYLEHKSEIKGTGITHRVPWKQGILSVFKKILKVI